MTGFASLSKSSAVGEVALAIKSLNHRGLDVHFQMSNDLDRFENTLRAILRRQVARGHFQVRVNFTRTTATAPVLNRGLLDAYVASFREASSRLGLVGEPDLNSALALPGMFSQSGGEEPDDAVGLLLSEAMEEAVASLNGFREREGLELAEELKLRIKTIRAATAKMQQLRVKAVSAYQARLAERITELLNGASVEPHRLAQEVAFLVDRSDISEELSRLTVHTSQLEALLAAGGEIGKKIDFLLQEMGREANTILSKTSGAGDLGLAITEAGLAAKAEIEKIREQSLNLE
jgi:uncharacterized protein (TIGR00255 family)